MARSLSRLETLEGAYILAPKKRVRYKDITKSYDRALDRCGALEDRDMIDEDKTAATWKTSAISSICDRVLYSDILKAQAV